MKQINSIQNPLIKSLVLLQEKSKARKQSGTFLIEGKREIDLALKGQFSIETILFLPSLLSDKEVEKYSNSKSKINYSKPFTQNFIINFGKRSRDMINV